MSYSANRDVLEEMLKDKEFAPYITQWIDYEANYQHRLKMVHDLRLKDGRVLTRYRPNANAWFRMDEGFNPERIGDEEVSHIRLSLNQGWT